MKKLYVSYTYLDIIEVPEDASHEDILEILEELAPIEGWNDIDYTEIKE